MRSWTYNAPSSDKVRSFAKGLRTSKTAAALLARLGLESVEDAKRFLDPKLGEIEDPFDIPSLKKAAQRLSQAIDDVHRVVICGDYDVDGVTSTALLVDILRSFDCYPHFIVPLRLTEGYGLSQQAADRALQEAGSTDLFIALDCGTNSVDETQSILRRGCDVIIVDHHQSKLPQSKEAILVNPHVDSCATGCSQNLCTVGLVFKLAHGLLKVRRDKGDERAHKIKLRSYLDFVSMGTVADLVPLTGENRTFARIGLQQLAKTGREGLRCLMQVSGIEADNGVNPVDISFRIGPRINASGRLADAALAVELMLSDDRRYSMETSLKLDSFNRERQEIERAITEEALREIDADPVDRHGIVVYGEDWHPGVVGVVASRLAKACNRPCIVLGKEGEMAKGSGRSVEGVDMIEVLGDIAEDLNSWGGHPMAVGISLEAAKVDILKDYFDKAVKRFLDTHTIEKTIDISCWLSLGEITPALLEEISRLEPFGQQNNEPIFATKQVVFRRPPTVFKDNHFRFMLSEGDGNPVHGVAWNMADRIPPLGESLDVAYKLVWNCFAGRRYLQMQLVDWRNAQ